LTATPHVAHRLTAAGRNSEGSYFNCSKQGQHRIQRRLLGAYPSRCSKLPRKAIPPPLWALLKCLAVLTGKILSLDSAGI